MANVFSFIDYAFEFDQMRAVMRYSQDDVVFTDVIEFSFEPVAGVDQSLLDRAMRSLWLMNGVSYYKSGMAPVIDAKEANLTPDEAKFFSQTFRLGLGQLCYENKLDLARVATFEPTAEAGHHPVAAISLRGSVVGFGGGKDSLVTTTLLERADEDFVTYSATYLPDENPALARLARAVGRPHLVIKRRFDPQLFALNAAGAYNGHVPVTAIIMFIGLVAAILTGRRNVIMSNEASAGEGNLQYAGETINHQYAKTFEYERALNAHVRKSISPDMAVFSLLRPLSELAIAEQFAHGPFQRYAGLYSSCNRNFKADAQDFGWCGQCPKCAFVYLILAPFVAKDKLDAQLGGDLLAKPELEDTYRELLGLSGHKPFECVGEIEECRLAMRRLASGTQYPAAQRFELPPASADYPKTWGEHELPEHFERLLKREMAR